MADLEHKPDFAFPKRTKYVTFVSEFENGSEQRRSRRENALKEWTLRYRNQSQDVVDDIQDLFDTKKGSFATFSWLNPNDSVEYTVRFKEDVFEPTLIAYGLYDFEFSLVQVL